MDLAKYVGIFFEKIVNPLSDNPTKWLVTLKQIVGKSRLIV